MLSYSVQVRCLSDRCESDSVKVTDFKAADIKFGRNQFVFVKMTDVLKEVTVSKWQMLKWVIN